jgi:hypothetical protein
MSLQENQELKPLSSERTAKKRKVGIGLVIISFVLYGGLLFVPFTDFSTGIKVAISSALVIIGEITFLIGGFILGKEVVARYKRYINPMNWIKNKK